MEYAHINFKQTKCKLLIHNPGQIKEKSALLQLPDAE
jgi:hypothetical protein